MALRAEIIAVGSELLTPLRSDTNALVLTARLRRSPTMPGSSKARSATPSRARRW
jgi:hypothetical protein